jgi:hypothetical protein
MTSWSGKQERSGLTRSSRHLTLPEILSNITPGSVQAICVAMPQMTLPDTSIRDFRQTYIPSHVLRNGFSEYNENINSVHPVNAFLKVLGSIQDRISQTSKVSGQMTGPDQ